MKKVFVTGATGFIGANLVYRLIQKGYEVHILIRQSSNLWRIKDIILKLHTHKVDLLEKHRLLNLMNKIKPDAIFHLANLGLYGRVDSPIEESIKINLIGTINLIESTRNINYKCFVNTASSSEYGIKTAPMKETDPCQPNSNYALTKLAATLYAQSYVKKNKKPIVTLRLFSPFGPFDHSARFITQTVIKLLRNKEILIKNPDAFRDYIFIEDVIDAYLLCLRYTEGLSGEVINIGSGKQTSIRDLLNLLTHLVHSKSQIVYDKPKIVEKIIWQANIQKAKQELRWRPKRTLSQGLKETIDWIKNNSFYYD